MNLLAIEKSAKAKRMAEAILKHLEEWMMRVSREQSRGPIGSIYGELKLGNIEPEDFNKLTQKFAEIIEREL